MRRPKTTFGTLLGLTLVLPACVNEPGSSGATETTTRRSAVTAASASPNVFVPHREDDFGQPRRSVTLRPPGPLVPSPPPPAAVPGSQHSGHFRNKAVAKAAPPAPTQQPPPVPGWYVARQNEYQRQWSELQPTISKLSPEEQRARRATLKRQVLGD